MAGIPRPATESVRAQTIPSQGEIANQHPCEACSANRTHTHTIRSPVTAPSSLSEPNSTYDHAMPCEPLAIPSHRGASGSSLLFGTTSQYDSCSPPVFGPSTLCTACIAPPAQSTDPATNCWFRRRLTDPRTVVNYTDKGCKPRKTPLLTV